MRHFWPRSIGKFNVRKSVVVGERVERKGKDSGKGGKHEKRERGKEGRREGGKGERGTKEGRNGKKEKRKETRRFSIKTFFSGGELMKTMM